jgi:hypothetical protein
MKRLFGGLVILAVAIGLPSCSGDPTGDLREPVGIVATPSVLFIDVGDTEPVVVSLTDDQGNQVATTYELADIGSGITVVQDTTFQHTNSPGVTIDRSVRFQVTGTGIANSSFTVNAGGKSVVVPVNVTPDVVDIVVSNPAPAWGDIITLTAPAGLLFTAESEVTFAGGPPAQIVSLSADRTVLTVIPGPNTVGAVTVSHATVAFDESLDFTVTSIATVTSPELTAVDGSFSNQAPALGETVILTLPAGIKVIPESVAVDSGLVLEGAVNPVDVVVAPDSGSISFVPAPNSDSVLSIRGVIPAVLPQFPQLLQTTLKVTTPSIDSIAVTFSNPNPAVLEEIIATAPAGFSFGIGPTDSTAFSWGGLPAVIGSLAAGSANITPLPGSAGHASISNVIVNAAPQFRLTLPATVPVTVPPVVPLEGTEDPTTAPEITLPGPGGSITINDAGTYDYTAPLIGGAFPTPARLYKIVVPAPLSLTVEVDWPTGQDLGVYYLAADGVGEPAEGFPADCCGPGVHPETSTSSLLAGTYLLAVVNFGVGDPPVFSLTLSR